jgi:hypothetical protein
MTGIGGPTLQELTSLDPEVPHAGRVYNVWLDGTDHFGPDREVAAEVISRRPQVVDAAVANRQFLGRAVRYIARCHGVHQFIDIGSGLPTAENTHQVAQVVDSWARVMYVDNDPLILSHTKPLLDSTIEGNCDYLHADLRNTKYLLKEARRTLDFNLPVGVLLLAVLHFIPDADDPAGLVAALLEPLTAGSFVVISHLTGDFAPEAVGEGIAAYNALVPTPVVARNHAQVTELFGNLALVPPGVVPVNEWRSETVTKGVIDVYGGVARKAPRRWW